MRRVAVALLGLIGGCTVGALATVLCAALGLQSRNWNTLLTVNILAGLGGVAVGTAISRDTDEITEAELNRAIGKLNGRYELAPGSEDKLAILIELKDELNHGR